MQPCSHQSNYDGSNMVVIMTPSSLQVAAQEYVLAIQYDPHHWEAHQHLGRLLTTEPPVQLHFQGSSERLRKVCWIVGWPIL